MKLEEPKFTITGSIEITARSGDRIVDTRSVRNLVVTAGKRHLLSLIGGVAGYGGIKAMRVGNGGAGYTGVGATGTQPAELFVPRAFTLADTDLRHALGYQQGIDPNGTVVTLVAQTVKVSATFHASQTSANQFGFEPFVINEVALIGQGPSGDVPLALSAFKAIAFDPASTMIVQFEWTLQVN